MTEAGRGGSIVNVSSQPSLVGLKGHISYGSSKAALDNIMRVGALELGQCGIHVNSVNPTVIMTEMSKWYWGRADVGDPYLAIQPVHKWATVEDISGPICFLLSNDAAMISGVTLQITRRLHRRVICGDLRLPARHVLVPGGNVVRTAGWQ